MGGRREGREATRVLWRSMRAMRRMLEVGWVVLMIWLDDAGARFRDGAWTEEFVLMSALCRDGRGLSCVLYLMLFAVA
jgi:hypothetical protein